MSCGVRRMSIDGLSPDITNALIIGVIIAKHPLRRFVSKKDGLERGVWNFTLRDSPTDTINVNWWGSAEGAVTCSQMFSIGDVVEITNPRVIFVQPGDAGTKFRPTVSSPFEIELQEYRNDILPHMEPDTPFIRELMKIPTKPPGDYLRLSDVCSYGKSMQGEHVNLLVGLIFVGILNQVSPVRSVVTRRTSVNCLCRDLIVLDETDRDFHITVWDEEILHWADVWKPRKTVLFLADMKVVFNDYKQAVTVNVCSRTVITIDPDIPEARNLRAYMETVPVLPAALLDHISDSVNDDSGLDLVMTSAQVLDKAYSGETPGGKFSALLYAHVTHLNLDGLDRIFTFKCVNCGACQDERQPCQSLECAGHPPPQLAVFSLRVDLTDHRGSLLDCRLTGSRAASVLGCSEESFMAMTMEERTERKWRLLLQRCAARVMVLCAASGRPRPLISLLACSPADPAVVSAKLPIY